MTANGRRLIEDRLPIAVINELAQREKIGHIGIHPRKLHLWWARRPLAAARAAVYSALVPAAGRDMENDAGFYGELCRWDVAETVLRRARSEILEANGGKPPKILDMFAGGGAIPLEAARLGCEVTAVELNPVAHLIEKCMLEYPQRFPAIADDIHFWGRRWVTLSWERLGDLYPPVVTSDVQQVLVGNSPTHGRRPIAYLWTRTVRCPNPAMEEHSVPLVRQTWLARRNGHYVALRPLVDREHLSIRYQVVEASTQAELGFDPAVGSTRGQANCPICGAMVTAVYVKAEATAGRLAVAPLAAVVLRPSGRGRQYLPAGSYGLPDVAECWRRLKELDVSAPNEELVAGDGRWFQPWFYGMRHFGDLFTPRQLLSLCTLASGVREVHREMIANGIEPERAAAVATYLGLCLDRSADCNSSLSRWGVNSETAANTYSRQALPMVWDFMESNPFGGAAGDIGEYVENVAAIAASLAHVPSARLIRGSADLLPLDDETQDVIVTDPPYYDNISYADLSDFFYVWLKRSVGELHPEHLGGHLTPKRSEAVAAVYRHGGDRDKARRFYEAAMAACFVEGHRVLKAGAPMVCIYAHKTTLGWSSLVEALRLAGFTITEAWPLDTEMPERSVGQGTASLASSIFLVARKREASAGTGAASDVMLELGRIIKERLTSLAAAGVTGSDLVIATVGAGLAAFTRYERVEQENGDSLPAERFLILVQDRVLDAIFGNLQGVDPATRFYVAGQFSYGYRAVAFDEANNLAHVTHVELDGPRGLTRGRNPIVQKKGSTVALRDYDARGSDPGLGLPADGGDPARLIDVVQGMLWRADYRPSELKEYLAAARPDGELLRNVVQALAGRALRTGGRDGKTPEQAAAERLLGSWRHLVEANLLL